MGRGRVQGPLSPKICMSWLEEPKRQFSSQPFFMDGSAEVWDWSGMGRALSLCPSLCLSHPQLQPSGREEHLPTLGSETLVGGTQERVHLHPSSHPSLPDGDPFAALGTWLSLSGFSFPSGKLGEVEMNNLKGPRWQQCPVKPASFPRPLALKSLEAAIFAVFSPFSMFGHFCSFKTVPLSLLQVVAGRSQPAPKRLGRC